MCVPNAVAYSMTVTIFTSFDSTNFAARTYKQHLLQLLLLPLRQVIIDYSELMQDLGYQALRNLLDATAFVTALYVGCQTFAAKPATADFPASV